MSPVFPHPGSYSDMVTAGVCEGNHEAVVARHHRTRFHAPPDTLPDTLPRGETWQTGTGSVGAPGHGHEPRPGRTPDCPRCMRNIRFDASGPGCSPQEKLPLQVDWLPFRGRHHTLHFLYTDSDFRSLLSTSTATGRRSSSSDFFITTSRLSSRSIPLQQNICE